MNPPKEMSGKATINSFDIDPEWGDIDLLEQVERAMGIEVSNFEAANVANFGDLFDLVCSKLEGPGKPSSCFSAHVFYNLRSSLVDGPLARSVGPQTQLAQVRPGGDEREFWSAAENRLGFKIPGNVVGNGCLFSVFSAITLFCVALFIQTTLTVLLFFVSIGFAFYFLRTDQGHFDVPKQATFGDLAQRIASLNFGLLTRRLGGYRKHELWNSLVTIINEDVGRPIAPSDVSRESLFFDSQLPHDHLR